MQSITFRAATLDDASAIAFVQFKGWHDTYKGIISDEELSEFTHEGQTEWWTKVIPIQKGFVTVMQNEEDGIIGYVSGGRNRIKELNCDGEIYALYLLKKYHGTGAGRQLFLKGIAQLAEKGCKSFGLVVLKDSPTVQFYNKFNPDIEICKDADGLYELALGWSDINKFRA
jgi:GNAT superfamily N-acetyltransferase